MKRSIAILLTLILLCGGILPAFAESDWHAYLEGDTSLAAISSFKITTDGKAKQLELKWSALPRAMEYFIYRSTTGKSGSYQKIADTTATWYTDTGLKNSTTYYYAVRAAAWNGERTIYSPYKKACLSTRITKSYAAKRFNAAYKAMGKVYYVVDFDDCILKDEDGGYFYIALKGVNSLAQFRKYLQKYFTKALASRMFPDAKEEDGKVYIFLPEGIGADDYLKLNKTTVSGVKYTDTRVKMRVNETYGTFYDEDFKTSTVQGLTFENGKWVFDETGADFWINNLIFDYMK